MKQQRQRDRRKRRRDDRTVVTSVMHDWFGGSSKMREDSRRPARLRGQLGLKGNEHLKLIGASGTPLGSCFVAFGYAGFSVLSVPAKAIEVNHTGLNGRARLEAQVEICFLRMRNSWHVGSLKYVAQWQPEDSRVALSSSIILFRLTQPLLATLTRLEDSACVTHRH